MENRTFESNRFQLIKRHYYGDTVRAIFLIAGVVMIVTFPFFSNLTPVPVPLSILSMVILVVFGGLLNPVKSFLPFLDIIIPIAGFVFFEYQATYTYSNIAPVDVRVPEFFWINQILAVLFFVAIYLSVKTARGCVVEEER